MKKKLILGVLSVTLLLLCLLSGTGCEWVEGDLWINSCEVVAEVNAQGDLIVAETWNVENSSDEGYRNLYKTVNLYDTNFGVADSFEWIGVTDNDYGQEIRYDANIFTISDYVLSSYPNTYYMYSTDANTYEIGVILPTFYETRSITFRYKIKNFMGGYSDTAEFYWKLFSEDFQLYIKSLQMTITFPETVDFEDFDNNFAYLHCVEESLIALDGNVMRITGEKIDAGTQVEVHAMLDRDSFTLRKKVPTAGKEHLVNQEEIWLQEWEEAQKKARILGIVDVYGSIAVIVLAFVYVIVSRIKGPYKIKEKNYVREIPSDWRPASKGHLFYYYKKGGASKHINALVSATILDLARRDFLDILPDSDEEYRLDIHEISLTQRGELNEYEQQLYTFLKEVQEYYHAPFTMKDFEKYTKKHAEISFRRMAYFSDMSEAELKKYRKTKKAQASALIPFLVIALGFALEVLSLGVEFLPFACMIGGVIALFLQYKTPRLSEEGNAKYAEIVGLKDFLTDFSNLKEYDIPQLILWEEYLVYATMMGISEKVLQNLKARYPEMLEKQYDSGYYRRGYIYSYMYLSTHSYRGGNFFDMGSHMQQAMTNVQNAARAGAPTSSRGGGFGGGGHGGSGFGGGGGGHGGGGGGGRH